MVANSIIIHILIIKYLLDALSLFRIIGFVVSINSLSQYISI